MEDIADPPVRRRVVCYPVQLATPAPLTSAVVERKEQGEVTVLTYHGDTQRLNTPYFYKLVSGAEYLVELERSTKNRLDGFSNFYRTS